HHYDRKAASRLTRSQAPADFEPGYAGQLPIEDNEIRRVLGEAKLGFVAPGNALDDITLRFEIVGEQQGQIGFVLDHENAWSRHRVRSGRLVARLVHLDRPPAPASTSSTSPPLGRSDGRLEPVTR